MPGLLLNRETVCHRSISVNCYVTLGGLEGKGLRAYLLSSILKGLPNFYWSEKQETSSTHKMQLRRTAGLSTGERAARGHVGLGFIERDGWEGEREGLSTAQSALSVARSCLSSLPWSCLPLHLHGTAPLAHLVPAVLKVCSLEQQQRHHLKTCQQCKFSDLPLDGWVRTSRGGAQQSVLMTFKKA